MESFEANNKNNLVVLDTKTKEVLCGNIKISKAMEKKFKELLSKSFYAYLRRALANS